MKGGRVSFTEGFQRVVGWAYLGDKSLVDSCVKKNNEDGEEDNEEEDK